MCESEMPRKIREQEATGHLLEFPAQTVRQIDSTRCGIRTQYPISWDQRVLA